MVKGWGSRRKPGRGKAWMKERRKIARLGEEMLWRDVMGGQEPGIIYISGGTVNVLKDYRVQIRGWCIGG